MLPKYSDIVDLLKKGATLEAQQKIMDLREAAMQLQEENHELRAQVRSLEDALKVKASLTWDKPYYWQVDGGQKDGPYCQVCYDKEGLLIRLQSNSRGHWRCHSCSSNFYDSSYSPPRRQRSQGGDWMGRM